MKIKIIIVLMVSAILIFNLKTATADSGIELNLVAKEEVVTLNAKGEKVVSLIEPTSVIPGDTIVYATHYHNNGKESAEDVVITTPIPKDTVYVDGSAVTDKAAVSYSIDHGKKFDTPENLTITESDGKKRPATVDDYTHIRWRLRRVAPAEDGSVEFHAKVR